MSFFARLFWLMVMHALLDYQLQLEPVASFKDPTFQNGKRATLGPWWWSMTAHALINGGGVALVTGIWWIGLLETAFHFLLDTGKCLGWITTVDDQIGHVMSKVAWATMAWFC